MNNNKATAACICLLVFTAMTNAEIRIMPERPHGQKSANKKTSYSSGLLRTQITREMQEATAANMKAIESEWKPLLQRAHYEVFAGRTNAARNLLQQAVETSEISYWVSGRFEHDWIMADILLSEGRALEAFQLLDSYQGKIGGTATQEHLFLAAFYAGLVTREDLVQVHNRLDDWFGPGVQEYLPSINTANGAEALVLLLVASFSRQDENEIEFWLLKSHEADPKSVITNYKLAQLYRGHHMFLRAYHYYDLAYSQSTGEWKTKLFRDRRRTWRQVRIANGEIEK